MTATAAYPHPAFAWSTYCSAAVVEKRAAWATQTLPLSLPLSLSLSGWLASVRAVPPRLRSFFLGWYSKGARAPDHRIMPDISSKPM